MNRRKGLHCIARILQMRAPRVRVRAKTANQHVQERVLLGRLPIGASPNEPELALRAMVAHMQRVDPTVHLRAYDTALEAERRLITKNGKVLRIHFPNLEAISEVNRNVVQAAALNPLVGDNVLPDLHEGGRCVRETPENLVDGDL